MRRPFATIFAPFADDPRHLGHRRATRFARWLSAAGYGVNVVCAGGCSISCAAFIPVRDPMGVWSGSPNLNASESRRPVRGGRGIARRVLIPDPSIAWALRVCCSRAVHAAARASSVLISTGPPESPHLAASFLSRSTGVPHLMDYRDGWIDEPLKAEIESNRVRRSLEQRLEAWALANATAVTVTSDSWSADLTRRHPWLGSRIHTTTNVIPTEYQPVACPREGRGIPRLMYAGKLSGSRLSQSVELLLDWLVREAAAVATPFEIVFLGDLSAPELIAIEQFSDAVAQFGWTARHQASCDYKAALAEIARADGLLLLSASKNAIPSKLFDYLATGRPIMCLAPRGSAVWTLCRELKQVWLIDTTSGGSDVGFCRPENLAIQYQPPIELTESRVADRFVALVERVRQSASDIQRRGRSRSRDKLPHYD